MGCPRPFGDTALPTCRLGRGGLPAALHDTLGAPACHLLPSPVDAEARHENTESSLTVHQLPVTVAQGPGALGDCQSPRRHPNNEHLKTRESSVFRGDG